LGVTPIMLVYLVGLVLALVFWRRCPVSCVLTLIATLLLLGLIVTSTFVYQYLFHARAEMDWPPERIELMYSVIRFVSSLLHALGIGLLLAAVFAGRKRAQQVGPGKFQ